MKSYLLVCLSLISAVPAFASSPKKVNEVNQTIQDCLDSKIHGVSIPFAGIDKVHDCLHDSLATSKFEDLRFLDQVCSKQGDTWNDHTGSTKAQLACYREGQAYFKNSKFDGSRDMSLEEKAGLAVDLCGAYPNYYKDSSADLTSYYMHDEETTTPLCYQGALVGMLTLRGPELAKKLQCDFSQQKGFYECIKAHVQVQVVTEQQSATPDDFHQLMLWGVKARGPLAMGLWGVNQTKSWKTQIPSTPYAYAIFYLRYKDEWAQANNEDAKKDQHAYHVWNQIQGTNWMQVK